MPMLIFFMTRAACASLPPSSRLALESSVDLRDNELNELQSQLFSASPAVPVRPEPIPSSLLPLVSYLFLLPSILFLLLMLSFPIPIQDNLLPALRKPQDSNNLLFKQAVWFSFQTFNSHCSVWLCRWSLIEHWKREHLWCRISGSYKGVRYSRSWDLDAQTVISWSLPRSLEWFSVYLSNRK